MASPSAGEVQHPIVATPVREQRIVGPAGSEDVRRTVWCTARGQSVPISMCQPCPRRERVTIDPAGRGSEVRCAMPPLELDGAGKGDALRMQAPVSELMTRRVICVRGTLSLR